MGILGQLIIGAALTFMGLILTGPASFLRFIPKSLALWLSGTSINALGMGVNMTVQGLALIHILGVSAGLSKKDVSGGIVACIGLFTMIVASAGSAISSAVYADFGIGTLSTSISLGYLLVATLSVGLMSRDLMKHDYFGSEENTEATEAADATAASKSKEK